jgi:catechol 2,3-dioxygenase-like lactoylglutathione lyase family enzyme
VSETTYGASSPADRSALEQSSIIVEGQPGTPTHTIGPRSMRWTHIALPCTDMDRTIDWYTRFTPLELLDRREDADGQGAWLGHPDQGDKPFILVLVSFYRDQAKGPQPVMAPFAHIGIEVASREEIEEIARRGDAEGCLAWPPTMMPPPIGYICALKDPDGNMIEFSYDQGVYAKAQEVWGAGD